MEEERQNISNIQTTSLLEDIIFVHILPRLPIKSITCFKSVSKPWLSSISTPQFAKSHLKLSTSPSLQFLIYSGSDAPPPLFTSVTFDEHGRVKEKVNLKYTFDGGHMYLVGCCNGLVCFYDKQFNFSICNPFIQQSSNIIKCPDLPSNRRIISAGFGYVSSIDDYKIACIIGPPHNNEIKDYDINVCLFSLKTGKWENSLSNISIDTEGSISQEVPVLVNDVLYWSVLNIEHIIGVNLITEEFVKIPIKSDDIVESKHPYEKAELIRINGRLCMCYDWCDYDDFFNAVDVLKVWRLNEDDSSWIEMEGVNGDGMKLLCVSENTGKWLVLNDQVLALVDPTESFHRQYQGGTHFGASVCKALEYKMSLISPLL